MAAQSEMFAALNENCFEINVSKGILVGMNYYYVVSFGDTLWYNSAKQMKVQLEMMFQKKKMNIPFSIENIDEHKL